MTEQEEDRRPKFKTYVKGTFLLSEDGLEYKEQNDEGKQVEKVVEDKIGFMSLQKQIEKEKTEKNDREKLAKKRNNSIVDKPTLIPIKDTPVDPVPEPILDNQKCEIATQEQFEYFQSYISQRQRERKFEEAEERQVERFLETQQKLASIPQIPVSIVFEKDDNKQEQFKQPKRLVKIKVKRKEPEKPADSSENRPKMEGDLSMGEMVQKVRVLNNQTVKRVAPVQQ